MLRKCANSSCNQQFHYTQGTKAFRVETRQGCTLSESETAVTIEYYWLCDACLILVLPLLSEQKTFSIPSSTVTRSVRMVKVDEAIAEGAVVADNFELVEPVLQ